MNANVDTSKMFTAGADTGYAELPVKPAFLRWTRGNAQLRAVVQSDPAAYFGGWRAMVKDAEGNDRPALPLPIVDRVSGDGKLTYPVYATNVLEFLPIAHRTRFELRVTEKDPNTGRDKTVIKSVSRSKREGYTPMRQVFGLVYNGEEKAPAVLIVDKWSSFITFNKAEQRWMKVKTPSGLALVRRYGSVGRKDKATGAITPNFEEYGKSLSTPIEAIGVEKPRFIEVGDDLVQLHYEAIEWAECPRWNAEGEVAAESGIESAYEKFMRRANELGLTNIDIEQTLAEAGNDYRKALSLIEESNISDLNAELESADTLY